MSLEQCDAMGLGRGTTIDVRWRTTLECKLWIVGGWPIPMRSWGILPTSTFSFRLPNSGPNVAMPISKGG